jgi:hypothetical protein
MELSHRSHRYQLRKYPVRGGMTWRWWIFEGNNRSHADTGVVVGAIVIRPKPLQRARSNIAYA